MKNLKSLVGYVAQTAGVLETALSDGFQTRDLLPIGLQLAQLPDVQKVWPLAKEEWESRTDEQVADLVNHFAENFDISSDNLERKIEKIFGLAAAAADLVGEFKKAA